MKTKFAALALAIVWLAGPFAACPAQEIPERTGDPYLGAIVIDGSNGDVLFEDNADTPGYPASIIKLMDLLIILQYNESGAVGLEDPVKVTAEAAKIGGSQVYLKEGEEFTVEELLYAMIVQSANDAATALALSIGGTKDAFVELMNGRAKAMRMDATTFHSVHGLPPGPGQQPDVSTARDIALLCRQLIKRPDALKYTSTQERGFRNDTFIMRTHNPLLAAVDGCDGLKTGYFVKAGFSIAATAERKGMRVIAVVLGSKDKATRNAKATELLAKGFLEIARRQVQFIEPTNAVPTGAGIAPPATP